MKNLATFILFFVLSGTGMLWSFTLDEAIQEALEKNPELIATGEKQNAAKTRKVQELSLPDPLVGIGYEGIPNGTLSLSEANMRMYTLSQAIPFPSKIYMKSSIASSDATIAEERYREKRNEVIARVKASYYGLFTVHKTIELTKENKELMQKLTKIAEQQYAIGKAAQHDVLKAQVELSFLIDDLLTLENEALPEAVAELNVLLNRPPAAFIDTLQPFEIPTLDLSLEELESLALQYRPDLRAAQQAHERSRQVYSLAKMAYLPDFMVTLKQQEMRMGAETETTRGIMVSASIPLWFWKKNSQLSEKRARMHESESQYQALKNAIFLEIQLTLDDYRAKGRRLNLYETSILPQAEQALKSATIAYRTGKIDFLALMNSEKMLRDAKLKYYAIKAQYGTDLARLEKAVGTTMAP